MDLDRRDNIIEPQIHPCNCFNLLSLTGTILGSNQPSNFKDRYVLGEQLGWGQFGIIRTCSDRLSGEILACKSIAKERLVTSEDVNSVKLEIEIMTKLSGHSNVVELKAVYEEENYVHLVMELCAGGELFHRIKKHGKFSEYEARVLFRHLMQVVEYCHDKGIVHRDLKPENILLATKSSSSPIKLADFGLATYIKPGQWLYGTVGSPFYIAPEVLAGGYNQAADVWSAGVILYILLNGVPPFWGKTKSKIFDAVRAADLQFPTDRWDHISTSAKDLITGMLCVDPSKRLTANDVLAHSWMKEIQESYKNDIFSLSSPFISTNLASNFSNGSPSPVFTCKSSFSSFLVDHSTLCSIARDFSFNSCCESNGPDFSSPVPSMPSFTFFSPSSTVEKRNNSLGFKAKLSTLDGDSRLGKLFVLPDPSQPIGDKLVETEHRTELWRRGKSGSKAWGIHSRRNRTIGVGELDQLDLIVTESVIRWVSCTHIQGAPSLRSSLVC